MSGDRSKVLIQCTGNSCHSQMAEAIINNHHGDMWQANSAGTKPAGYVLLKAIQFLHEINIDHQGRSNQIDEYKGENLNLVISVCDSAVEECPVWLGPGKKIHTPLPDPAEATGSEEEILSVFRAVRDSISQKISEALSDYRDSNS